MTDDATAAVLAAVGDLLPTLRKRAQDTELARRIPIESLEEITATGFFGLLRPRRYSGLEAHPAVFYTAAAELASACGSSGWVAAVLGVSPWNLALFDGRAQEEVWGSGVDVPLCSSYAMTGTAVPVEGGYQLSGTWGFASGCDHARWALLGARVIVDGEPVDSGTFLVPAGDYRVSDVWHAVGLRGTGSNDIHVDEVFVPAHRALSSDAVTACRTPGQQVNGGALYRIPFGCLHTSAITAAIVGMARGGYRAYLEQQSGRVRAALPGDARKDTGYRGDQFRDDPATLERIAFAATEIDAAWRQLTGNIDDMYALAAADRPIGPRDRLRLRRDQVRGTERAVAAMDRLFESSGGRALRPDSAVQRFWRDVHGGRAHAANDPERVYRMFAAAELAAVSQAHQP
ncbi:MULTISPECIES: 3-hydroxy-9,10-secoandrosta-1,3,5(10)-triene-9,17-dione monooxygenase oxygenase subunit [Nocardia]|nr:3-hydroxy-9,10-secoandrosta-1,3,5(10)-triene-9,17-dione monooxygenase oxygenase subunit [Nocardia sputorum]